LSENATELTCVAAIEALAAHPLLAKDKSARIAFEHLRLLMNYCRLMGIDEHVRFEPSLARGLDYYTGVIFETVGLL